MHFRWPLMWRSKHEATVAWIKQICTEQAYKLGNLAAFAMANEQLHSDRGRLGDELAAMQADRDRLRSHHGDTVEAKDREYLRLTAANYSLEAEIDRLRRELAAVGLLPPIDWAAPLPPGTVTVAVTDPTVEGGARGEIGGFADDPTSADPRRNMGLPMGIKPCPTTCPA